MKKGPLAFPELRYKLLAYLEFKTGVVGPRDLRGSELYANGSFSLAGTTFNGLTVGYCTPKSTGHRRLPLCGPLARPI
jgi:hypothetical protein